jgi:hypothetical protein
MLRDYDLPYQLEDLLDSTGYPRGLSYPPQALDTLQTIAIAEACGARRAREEIEVEEMRPMLRRLGRNDFDGIGLGGLGWNRMGDGLGLGRGLDRIYRPLLRDEGLGLETLGDLMVGGMIDYPGMGRLGGRRMGGMGGMGMGYGGMGGMDMGALRGYPGMGAMGRRRGLGMGGMGYGMGGMGMGGMGYGMGGGYRGLSQLR